MTNDVPPSGTTARRMPGYGFERAILRTAAAADEK